MEVRGKVVFLTGASEGIGLATARAFANAGARLALVARSAEKLEALADGLRAAGAEAIAVAADLRDPAQIERAVSTTVKHYSGIDILINNAGQSAVGRIAQLDVEHFRQIIDLNIFAPLLGIQAVIPTMREHGGGIIINISSMVSKMHIPGLGAYAATKSALNMLSDTARGELASDNIRVITVYPRLTSTDFQKHALGGAELRRPDSSVQIDTPEHVAAKILYAAEHEPEEQFMDR